MGKDRRLATSWRPITIGSAVQRLFHRVLIPKLDAAVSLNLNQRGFVPVDGCLANVITLDTLMGERTTSRRGLALVSKDIRKAFDSVSHESIRRAMDRSGVPNHLSDYIMASLGGSVTSFRVGHETSPCIEIRRGVKQRDPLSPLLFNLGVDELLDTLDSSEGSGCRFCNGTRCRVLAFGGDLVLTGENAEDVKGLLRTTEAFFHRRGMTLHPEKCRALVLVRSSSGAVYPAPKSGLSIEGKAIPSVTDINPMQYLGFTFDTHGVMKPNLTNYSAWLQRLAVLPLKPQQKMTLLKIYLLPRLFQFLMSPRAPAATLKNVDKATRHYVKRFLHLHLHTSDALIHAPLRDGGLGVMEMAVSIPAILLRRIENLASHSSDDAVLRAALSSARVISLTTKLEEHSQKFPADFHHREIIRGAFSVGLETQSRTPRLASELRNAPRDGQAGTGSGPSTCGCSVTILQANELGR
ncbi:hypothetical protein Zmor_004006 [Zophobas morio]|uniref:Reverse transcriptase domain-containing protein n=1 Tax=Zophobas morio TaxID=2755281 RepID=A0AA38HJW8_9CUCU|nr:hypothetical protein Zmor_004006 [Zophobas morio]